MYIRRGNMKITISQRKRADIMPDMMGLFFEDINYAADAALSQRLN